MPTGPKPGNEVVRTGGPLSHRSVPPSKRTLLLKGSPGQPGRLSPYLRPPAVGLEIWAGVPQSPASPRQDAGGGLAPFLLPATGRAAGPTGRPPRGVSCCWQLTPAPSPLSSTSSGEMPRNAPFTEGHAGRGSEPHAPSHRWVPCPASVSRVCEWIPTFPPWGGG